MLTTTEERQDLRRAGIQLRCTRCLAPLDRVAHTFVEQFTDSAWCQRCYGKWCRLVDGPDTLPDG